MKIAPKTASGPSNKPVQLDQLERPETGPIDLASFDFEEESDKKDLLSSEVADTLEKLDHEDRKWLLFELVLREPHFLEEAREGYPLSLMMMQVAEAELMQGNTSRSGKEQEGLKLDTIDDGGANVSKQDAADPSDEATPEEPGSSELKVAVPAEEDVDRLVQGVPPLGLKIGSLPPICVPPEEWMITFAQIDALPSANRDDYLLSLFVMSQTHAALLFEWQISLEAAQKEQESYKIHSDPRTSFFGGKSGESRDVDEDTVVERIKKAKAAMGRKYDNDGIEWSRVDDHHRDDFEHETTKAEVYAFLHPSAGHSTPKPGQDADDKFAEQRMAVFMIETKLISVIDLIVRTDCSAFPDRYRALRLLDLMKLAKAVVRVPKVLRGDLVDTVHALIAGILGLWGCMDQVEREWLKVRREPGQKGQSGFMCDIEKVAKGLEEVDLHERWTEVQVAIEI